MLIYDLEIVRAVPPRDGSRAEGVEYCEGWSDHAGMGISVICAYDYRTDRARVFCRDNFAEFVALAATQETLVGFNNTRFDDRVLAAAGLQLPSNRSYDLLVEIWRGLGLSSEFNVETHAGYSLQAMAAANFRIGKNGDGALAPLRWQRGETGGVIDYCLNDVHLTKRLLDRVIRWGALSDPKNPARSIKVRKPGA